MFFQCRWVESTDVGVVQIPENLLVLCCFALSAYYLNYSRIWEWGDKDTQQARQLHSSVSPAVNQANVGAAIWVECWSVPCVNPPPRSRANFLSLAAQQQQSGGWEGAGPLHPSPGSLTAPRHRAARLTVHARHQAHHHLHRGWVQVCPHWPHIPQNSQEATEPPWRTNICLLI